MMEAMGRGWDTGEASLTYLFLSRAMGPVPVQADGVSLWAPFSLTCGCWGVQTVFSHFFLQFQHSVLREDREKLQSLQSLIFAFPVLYFWRNRCKHHI